MRAREELASVAMAAAPATSTEVKAAIGMRGPRLLLFLASLCAGFSILAYLGVSLTKGDGVFAAVWLPNAVAVAALLHVRVAREWLVYAALFCGSVLGNLAASSDPVLAAGFSLANVVEILFVIKALRRFGPTPPDMERIPDIARFVLLAVIIAPLLSSLIVTAMMAPIDLASWKNWLGWYLADCMGMLLVAAPLLILVGAARGQIKIVRRHMGEWIGLMAAGFIITLTIFWQREYPLLFLAAPILVIHAFRLGSVGTALAFIQVAATATAMTSMGYGPVTLVKGPINEQLLVLEAFLATGFMVSLPVAAAITSQHSMMHRLREREEEFSMLAGNITDAVMRYSLDGVCTYASPSVSDVLGQGPESFLGKNTIERAHPDAQREIAEITQRMTSGRSDKERFTYRRMLDDADGNAVYIEADCVRVRDGDQAGQGAIFVSCRDVSERIRLEQDLVRARKYAEDAAAAKSEFLANMSHEIRTPMNGVLGFTDLLMLSEQTPEQRRFTELIDESGKSMMRLLNDILDISKIEAGQAAIIDEPVKLAHLLSGCLKLHSANAAQRGVSLKLEIDKALPEAIISDGLRLRQIALNLIGNAVKFTHEGTVTLRARQRGDRIIITVEDTGIGIAEDQIDHVFKPFNQADNAISRRFGGTGLGLAISRQLADLLGGTLKVASVLGEGSTFELVLPMKIASGSPDETPQRAAVSRIAEMPATSRILLAEDHDINRILATVMLERCGQVVETVEDGEQAVAAALKAKADGRPFQLILMDVQMPNCDGYAATRRLRMAGIDNRELPIVALTANAYEEDVKAALKSGMQAHLAKPLEFEDLLKTLRRWLPPRSAPARPAAIKDGCAADVAKPGAPAPVNTDMADINTRWLERRGEALDAVSAALRAGSLTGESTAELARLVHKLAGAAGMFGEQELGRCAGALERALKDAGAAETRAQLAKDLLEAA